MNRCVHVLLLLLPLLASVAQADERSESSGVSPADRLPDGKPSAKILLIGKAPDHPHGTHMYLHTQRLLARCLENTPGITATVSNGWPSDPPVPDDVDAIVLYATPGAEFLLDGPGSRDFQRMMRQGTGLVTIHWASSVYRRNLDRLGDRWMDLLGGTWVSNDGLHTGTSRLKQLLPDHPVCRGWEPYELRDEFYLRPILRSGTPLLQVTVPQEDVVTGWVLQRSDSGRAFATTLGHFYDNFRIEAFRKMIVNGILWTAHVEVPPQGAPVDIPESLLKLPPAPKPQ